MDDARAMAGTARAASSVARVGFTFRRTPGIAYIRDLVRSGELGKVLHFSGRYWTDYGSSPTAPMSWRFKGNPARARWPTSEATWPTSPNSSAATSPRSTAAGSAPSSSSGRCRWDT